VKVPPFSDWTPPGDVCPAESVTLIVLPTPPVPSPTFFEMMSPVEVDPEMFPTHHFRVWWGAGRPGGVNENGVAAKPTGPLGPVASRSSSTGPNL
jgi:hypothetical protein